MSTVWRELEQRVKEKRKYYIYGAGVVAYNVYIALKQLWNMEPECFLVTDREKLYAEIDRIPVVDWKTVRVTIDKNTPIIIATPEIYHTSIMDTLQQSEINCAFCVDTHVEYILMSNYFRKGKQVQILSDLPLNQNCLDKNVANQFSVYMAKSHKDKLLTKKYEIPQWIYPMQAGKVCTDFHIADLNDAIGENISYKNPNYCELTVTFWVWKNKKNTYKGICHYRRMLLLDEKQLNQCVQNDVDVVLPLPFVCYPSARGQYERYIGQEDLDALQRTISEIAPEYLAVWQQLDRQSLFYNYNMLIAKESIFNQYSKWLFTILEHAEKYCDPRQERSDRYAGYLGELLTSLYVFHHMDEWNIAHAEKNWMV